MKTKQNSVTNVAIYGLTFLLDNEKKEAKLHFRQLNETQMHCNTSFEIHYKVLTRERQIFNKMMRAEIEKPLRTFVTFTKI